MSTILFSSPIFGPVKSRRLGISLGINLMPADGKLCTFDCIYCECGFNSERKSKGHRPSRETVCIALEEKLKLMLREGNLPDVLTFAGNGEPTAHPEFAEIIDDTILLRNQYCPMAKVTVLSNATFAKYPKIHRALEKIDNNILKLDTVNADYIARVDRPVGRYDVKEIIETIRSFNGTAIVQSMFLRGSYQGVDVDNTLPEYVDEWLRAIQYISPREVMIYTLDRNTPAQQLYKIEPEKLDGIAERVRMLGVPCQVSY